MNEKRPAPTERWATTEKIGTDAHTVILVILVTCAVLSTLALVGICAALFAMQYDIGAFLDGTAWDAPWINVIERGPVE